MTVREWVTHWQATYDKPVVKASTYAAHNYIFVNHILPKLGDVHLSELTEAKVGDFLEERRQFGGHRPESPNYPGLGKESLRHIQTLLRMVLDKAVEEGKMELNPALPFYMAKPKAVTANVMTPMEVELYLDAAEQLGHLPMFLLELTIGLRPAELLNLRWDDLDAKAEMLTVHGYDGRTRQVQLTQEVVEQLRLEHAKHPKHPMMFVCRRTWKPYSTNAARLLHKRITEAAGLDHVRFVDLRHTCASHALRNGMDVRDLAKMLGNSRLDATKRNYEEIAAGTVLHGNEIGEKKLIQINALLGI